MAGFMDWYNHVFFELADRRADNLWLMSSPVPVVLITLSYLYFVKSLGPRLMKNRPPFDLDKVIQVYNLFQIAYCSYLIYSIHRFRMSVNFFCESIDYTDSPGGLEMLRLAWLYFMLKFIDLLDTVFFVLRKKFNQVTFLHVYHHAMMFDFMWIAVKYVPGGHGTLVGYVNCYVHIAMYGYYFVTNRWPEYKKNIWWKKYITIIQIVQFLWVFGNTLPLLVINCPYPKTMTYIILLQNGLMLKMFTDFYIRTYMKKKDK